MLLLLLLAALAAAHEVVLGHMVEVRGAGGAVLVLSARMGIPPRDVRLVADGTHGAIVVAASPLGTSLSAVVDGPGWTELLHVAGAHLRVPLLVDPGAVAAVCPTCDGVIGLGGSSPLWALWRRVEISDAGLRLDGATGRAGALADGVVAWATCRQPSDLLCDTDAEAEGMAFRFLLAPAGPRTVLPNDVFHALRGGRTLADDWPDLTLSLRRGGGARDRRYGTSLDLRIPGAQVLRHVWGEPGVLSVGRGDAVGQLGWEALRAGAVVRDWNGGRAAWVPRVTQRNYTVLQELAKLLLWGAFGYTRESRPLFLLFGALARDHPWSVIFDVVADLIAVAAPPLFVWQRGTWDVVVRGAPWLPAAAIALYAAAAAWLAATAVARAVPAQRLPPAVSGRTLVVHDWARDALLLLGLWLVYLATVGDRPRSLGLLAVWAWWCILLGMTAAGAVVGTLARRPPTPDWGVFLLTAGLASAAWTGYVGATVVPALAEIATVYFYLSQGLTVAVFLLASLVLAAYVGEGRAYSLFIHINGPARPVATTRRTAST